MTILNTKNGKIAFGITLLTFILAVMLQTINRIWLVEMPVAIALFTGLSIAGYFYYRSYKEENKGKF